MKLQYCNEYSINVFQKVAFLFYLVASNKCLCHEHGKFAKFHFATCASNWFLNSKRKISLSVGVQSRKWKINCLLYWFDQQFRKTTCK